MPRSLGRQLVLAVVYVRATICQRFCSQTKQDAIRRQDGETYKLGSIVYWACAVWPFFSDACISTTPCIVIAPSERERARDPERAEDVKSGKDGETEKRTCFGVVEERVGRALDAPGGDRGDGRVVVCYPRSVTEDGISEKLTSHNSSRTYSCGRRTRFKRNRGSQ